MTALTRFAVWSMGSDFDAMLLLPLTGWGSENDQRQAHKGGFNHHLIKPVDLATVTSLLDQAGLGQLRPPAV